jgi:glutathione S-transferase
MDRISRHHAGDERLVMKLPTLIQPGILIVVSGIPPHAPGTNITDYTIPVIKLPTGEYIMDSFAIAKELERLHPSPSLHLDDPVLEKVMTTLPKAAGALRPLFLIRVHRILPERSQQYFRADREKRFGGTLEELENAGSNAWEAAEPHFKELATMLRENPGPYFMGSQVSYADFVLVSCFKMFHRAGLWDNIQKIDKEAFEAVYAGCEEWMQRDDH